MPPCVVLASSLRPGYVTWMSPAAKVFEALSWGPLFLLAPFFGLWSGGQSSRVAKLASAMGSQHLRLEMFDLFHELRDQVCLLPFNHYSSLSNISIAAASKCRNRKFINIKAGTLLGSSHLQSQASRRPIFHVVSISIFDIFFRILITWNLILGIIGSTPQL